tara:strand:+ start:65 stop:883 length:819 start_codon:yes stop_codon:yes gene_type:complete
MPWKYGQKTLRVGKAWVDDENFKHPYRWVQWSDADKEKWGVTWEDDPTPLAPYDNFYYYGWNSDGDALRPKPLADLKVSKVVEAKSHSASALASTDWYVTRKSETNTAIPSEITAYRTAVRTNYTSLKTAINNASNIAGLQALYETTAGASDIAKEIDATSSSVVSTSGNTITSNGHGFVNDEQVYYYVGRNSDSENAAVIGGLVNNTTYFIHSAATNTFKLSESHSNCGDAAQIQISGLSSDGTKQTFTSQGKPGKGQTWPNPDMPKYDGS